MLRLQDYTRTDDIGSWTPPWVTAQHGDMSIGLVRGLTMGVLLVAMAMTVWLIGVATEMRGLMAGLAFWPLLPYLLLLVLAGGLQARGAAVAMLAASLAATGLGVGAYYVAFVRGEAPGSPGVLVVVPLVQICAAATILGLAGARQRWKG